MSSLEIDGLRFSKVNTGSVFVGESKGGWIYAGQRPRHEVKCPEFYIMENVLTNQQLSNLLESKISLGDETVWNSERLSVIIAMVNDSLNENLGTLNGDFTNWEIRCPTQGEWMHAREQKVIEINCKTKEILADAVAGNYRGAMMDGRPRTFEGHGPMQWHTATMEIHPSNKDIIALSSAPMDRENKGLSLRLALTPIRKGSPVTVPRKADLAGNIKSELIWTTLLGVVPSFAIPWLRGMGDYVYSGWVNLLFGGLCAGFVTGALWRPRRPIIMYEDGEQNHS